ncbi:hypothetical protein [Pleurocapsa sp. PCC 7319]|uniref:hypothetical protein n=1 Tax=Pleurocapsa sp. PCC 7319 TaxID=118161 RepID=UPI00034C4A9D|nr:hypothetical protein [Pleurocapsa sp. PCC 7319]
MYSTTWKTEEIRNYCSPLILKDAEIYVKSIRKEIERISFIFNKLSKEDIPLGNTNKIYKIKIQTEIYIESLAFNLHSLADVCSHIIYYLILKPKSLTIKEKQININKVVDKLEHLKNQNNIQWQQQYLNKLIDRINDLINLSEYLYIAAFFNTVKHRQLIETEYKFQMNQSKIIDSGWKIDAFSKDGDNFTSVSLKEILIDYHPKIVDCTLYIGQAINNYCRATYIGN